jgi:large subunit ribosomal protein L28
MARVCDVTGKRALSGNKVSHSNHKTKKQSQPNLQKRRFFLVDEKRWIRLRVSTAAIRNIDKRGLAAVVAELRARGVRV